MTRPKCECVASALDGASSRSQYATDPAKTLLYAGGRLENATRSGRRNSCGALRWQIARGLCVMPPKSNHNRPERKQTNPDILPFFRSGQKILKEESLLTFYAGLNEEQRKALANDILFFRADAAQQRRLRTDTGARCHSRDNLPILCLSAQQELRLFFPGFYDGQMEQTACSDLTQSSPPSLKDHK